MRRISMVGTVVLLASLLGVSVTFLGASEARSEPSQGSSGVSQGSVVDPDSPEAKAAQKDLAKEEKLPDYTQVVDNTTKGRFAAPGWEERSDSEWSHGGSYVAASGGRAARFEVKIPTTNDYSVYAWWPEAEANGTGARFSVQTGRGTKQSKIDQRTEGGMWIKLGTYAMKKGERAVQVAAKSAGGGQVVADAVAVVRGHSAASPDDEVASGDLATRSGTYSTKARQGSGYAVVRAARKHIGDRYSYGTCTRYYKSCTCLTKKAVAPFGHTLPMTELGQWRYSRSVYVKYAQLQPGDEVFFKENGRSGPITHVGIYSGNGYIVHASSYFGRVVEKQMKYVNGYAGAKRFRF